MYWLLVRKVNSENGEDEWNCKAFTWSIKIDITAIFFLALTRDAKLILQTRYSSL